MRIHYTYKLELGWRWWWYCCNDCIACIDCWSSIFCCRVVCFKITLSLHVTCYFASFFHYYYPHHHHHHHRYLMFHLFICTILFRNKNRTTTTITTLLLVVLHLKKSYNKFNHFMIRIKNSSQFLIKNVMHSYFNTVVMMTMVTFKYHPMLLIPVSLRNNVWK